MDYTVKALSNVNNLLGNIIFKYYGQMEKKN